jgi:hypothetical protein
MARMLAPKLVCEVVYVFNFASSVVGGGLWDMRGIV